jgi:hypothetical protein
LPGKATFLQVMRYPLPGKTAFLQTKALPSAGMHPHPADSQKLKKFNFMKGKSTDERQFYYKAE